MIGIVRHDGISSGALLLAGVAGACLAMAQPALAQDAPPAGSQVPADQPTEEQQQDIVVRGIRETIQTSINVKRTETAIVDALSAEDIGDLPALSIGEAIQTITGATTHREKGGATEIALRGLGSFLSNTTFNGREATNGSGDRSVNFNQFPSELINGIKIYKSQQANLIEGGVAGTIELGTLRPLDYGKRLIQAEVKANYNPYEDRITGASGWGWRGTLSYVDQFHAGALGDIGIAIGVQRNQVNNPEETYAASSTWVACDPTRPSTSACNQVSREQAAAGRDFYLAPNSATFRQITEADKRDAVMGSVQWKPSSRLDINLDFQYSKRDYTEDRHDLNISEATYNLRNVQYDDQHRLLYAEGTSSVEANGNYLTRDEKYIGIGGSVTWRATDRLTLNGDVSWSRTERGTVERSTRLRTDPLDLDGRRTAINNQRIPWVYDARGGFATAISFDPRFNPNDWSLFSDDARFRRDDEEKTDDIIAARFDAGYDLDGFLSKIEAGLRFSHRRYTAYDDRVELTQDDRAVDRAVSLACRRPFPQRDYLSGAPVQSITSWATYDTLCQFRNYLGTEDPGPNADLRSVTNADVRENVWAGYVMASYKGSLGSLPVRGNFGVRLIDTRVTSIGLRAGLDVIQNPDGSIRLEENGDFDSVRLTNHYFRALPSINANFDLARDVILRAAVYRAMSRPAPSDLAAGRSITLEDGTDFDNIADAIDNILAEGSPGLKPIMSWNGDLALEWYPNKDTMLAGTVYYKRFAGGFLPVAIDEDFEIGGETVTVPVTQRTNSDAKSTVYGLEITLANRFSWLPAPFDGLGTKISYDHALSNFKNYDIRLGDLLDPATGAVTPGMIPAANLNGYSRDVLSAQLYYQIGGLSLQAIGNYRSGYYQDFVGGNSQLRFVRSSETLDLRASYNINRNVSLRFEALNLFDEPKVTDMPVLGSSRQYHYYGSKYFIGLRVRL
ncbi:TonB-dependent receptor [Sphingomonas cannabina]|uniref:TonB-dependent receptor n=1 Tax=Sphingomonas cannabina TaxID=2899123 RepID=UPI001F33C35F|nr:TonB-dependent receptor [Sphingomonas cannabina]UIJ44016.1 TonB-dependent receptor [Sphingomonas cannabina]